jgi:multimeric flavodoxin WrbA
MADKTLLCLLASPRRGGNSDILADEVCRAFEQAGGRTEKVVLDRLELRDCTGCDWCKQPREGDEPCVLRDDMGTLYEKMLAADAILWATPVYYWSPAVALKTVLDRLFPWGDWQVTRHAKALDGRPVGAAISYADEEIATSGYYFAYQICKAAAECSGGRWAGSAHGQATDKGDIRQRHESLLAAEALGIKLHQWAAERE